MQLICKKFDELELFELYSILQLRSEVFVVEQNCIYQDMDGKDLVAYHVMLFEEKTLMACSRLLAPGISYDHYSSIGRVCSKLISRRNGFGLKIMKASIEYIENLYKDVDLKISAQSYLKKFYSSFGFEAVGDEYLEDSIPHLGMILKRSNPIK